ncbi:MAG: hypothetical protein ACYC8T_30215 [Myxococcaceae bacterium]
MPTQSESAVLGQKYAFATASLLLGLATFVNLLGLEKAGLAVAFGVLALRGQPPPALTTRRSFAKVGIALGSLALVAVPVMIVLFHDRFAELITALEKLP